MKNSLTPKACLLAKLELQARDLMNAAIDNIDNEPREMFKKNSLVEYTPEALQYLKKSRARFSKIVFLCKKIKIIKSAIFSNTTK